MLQSSPYLIWASAFRLAGNTAFIDQWLHIHERSLYTCVELINTQRTVTTPRNYIAICALINNFVFLVFLLFCVKKRYSSSIKLCDIACPDKFLVCITNKQIILQRIDAKVWKNLEQKVWLIIFYIIIKFSDSYVSPVRCMGTSNIGGVVKMQRSCVSGHAQLLK